MKGELDAVRWVVLLAAWAALTLLLVCLLGKAVRNNLPKVWATIVWVGFLALCLYSAWEILVPSR
jgi:hypothetical protein